VPLLPIASIVACVWLMLNLTGLTWIRFLILDDHRRARLLRIRPPPLGAGAAGDRRSQLARDFGVKTCAER